MMLKAPVKEVNYLQPAANVFKEATPVLGLIPVGRPHGYMHQAFWEG
ncbi:MAG: hypothetical protein AB1512_18270 [Thermodesulfobacteriota bacterium]